MASFQLTSNSRLANGKEFEVSPLSIESYSLLSEACVNDDAQSFVEALVLTTNYTDQELSLGDILQLAVYHRIQEYPDHPLVLKWDCAGTLVRDSAGNFYEHDEFDPHSVQDYEIVDCGTRNEVSYSMANFPFKYLGDTELGSDFSIPTASLYAEFVEFSKDPKTALLAPALVWVKTEINTISEKLKRVEEEGSELFKKAQAISHQCQHGPLQSLRSACPKCGLEVKKRIIVNQMSFFR
tara:strand:- start:2161 stop:2877 length:717 start_codon:yes stop_codon:yes gene_type:complete